MQHCICYCVAVVKPKCPFTSICCTNPQQLDTQDIHDLPLNHVLVLFTSPTVPHDGVGLVINTTSAVTRRTTNQSNV